MEIDPENKLEHSSQAISVLHQFYDAKVMLYVEGDDDIPFWDNMFKRYSPPGFYEIEQAHGKNGLKNYIEGVNNGTLRNVIVACDADYTTYFPNIKHSKKIVMTYGHSIENTMFCIPMINDYIKRLNNSTSDISNDIWNWLGQFYIDIMKLLPFDIINSCKELAEGSYKCLNYGFSYFAKGCKLDKSKIEEYIKDKINEVDLEMYNQVLGYCKNDERDTHKIVPGHFYADAVMKFIRSNVSVNLSNKAIYAEFASCRRICNQECVDLLFIKRQVCNVVKEVITCDE